MSKMHLRGDGPCCDCGTLDNIVWFTDNVLWNAVTGEQIVAEQPRAGILCIPCFVKRADAAGLRPTGWRLFAEWPWRIDRPSLDMELLVQALEEDFMDSEERNERFEAAERHAEHAARAVEHRHKSTPRPPRRRDRPMSTDEAAERLAGWLKLVFGSDVEHAAHPDPMSEQDWVALAQTGLKIAHERSAGTAPLDVERLADDVRYGYATSDYARGFNDGIDAFLACLTEGTDR